MERGLQPARTPNRITPPMPPAIRATLKHLMVFLGCVHITCGPLGFLQIIAWATMLASYSMEDGLTRGIADTFSGDRPCAMCLKIAESNTDHKRAPEAPNPERTASTSHMPQPWQNPGSIHLVPPSSHDLAHYLTGSYRDEVMISGLRTGPEPPPPRPLQLPS